MSLFFENKEFLDGGAEHIDALIHAAVADGSREAVVHGCWSIDRAVRIPSDFTLILDGCHLCLADGVYTNLFVNEHHDTEIGRTTAGTDRNIRILGRGEAILDGGNYNGLSERTHNKDGMPPIWKNNLVLFTNVDGFEISGLRCRNQRWWALCFVYSANGVLRDLDFTSSDIGVDAQGNRYRGLRRNAYGEILVKNSDGIDLRQGCHDFVIENITGFTEDDTVALTGLNWELERTFAVAGLAPDIARVRIHNVRSAAFCTNVRLLNQGGVPLHDIVVDGVTDLGRESEHMDHGLFAVRVGDTHLYGDRHATEEETYNITVRHVYGAGNYAVSLAGAIANFLLEDVTAAEGTPLLLDERTPSSV